MKISSIPAQITTVEDRIAGNLNLTQLLLLAIPLFLTAVIFFTLPPIGGYSLYKLLIAAFIITASSSLAIRANDRLIVDIIKQRFNFELRAHIYVYRKQQITDGLDDLVNFRQYRCRRTSAAIRSTQLTTRARFGSQKLLNDSDYRVAFQAKDGGLIVKVSTLQ